jgi:hypothetical protein
MACSGTALYMSFIIFGGLQNPVSHAYEKKLNMSGKNLLRRIFAPARRKVFWKMVVYFTTLSQ